MYLKKAKYLLILNNKKYFNEKNIYYNIHINYLY